MLKAEKRSEDEIIVFTPLGEVHITIVPHPGANATINVDILPDNGCILSGSGNKYGIENKRLSRGPRE